MNLPSQASPPAILRVFQSKNKIRAFHNTRTPGNDAPLGGLQLIAENGWFAARPSGTENICKIYAESFHGAEHLRRIPEETQAIVSDAMAAALGRAGLAPDTSKRRYHEQRTTRQQYFLQFLPRSFQNRNVL